LKRKNGSIHRVLDQRIVLRGREFHKFLIYQIIRDNVYFVWALPPNAEGTAPMRSNPIAHGERERMKNFLGQEGGAFIHGPL
jgi:hypothetical protein